MEGGGDSGFCGEFDVMMLNEHLRLCLSISKDEDMVDGDNNGPQVDILIDEYLKIFHQLYKFFCLLGTVFGFIGSDVKVKVEILETYRKGPNGHMYDNVSRMLLFEKETGYIHDNKSGNASRTFLRLHRALVFVSHFLGKTLTLADEDGTAQVAKETYNETLAKYHPWLIRKGALMAMYTLPTKKELIKQVGGGRQFDPNEVTQMLTEAIRVTREIHDHCEKLYAEHDLLTLP